MWVNKVCQCLLTERRLSWLQRIACHGVVWPGSRHTSAKKEDHGSFVQPLHVYTIVSPCIHTVVLRPQLPIRDVAVNITAILPALVH